MSENKNKAATEAKKRYNSKNYDQWIITAKKGKKEDYRDIAEQAGYNSLNGFVLEAIEEKVSRLEDDIINNNATLDNYLYGEYLKKNPRDPRERESHYAERISTGYAELKKSIAEYFSKE